MVYFSCFPLWYNEIEYWKVTKLLENRKKGEKCLVLQAGLIKDAGQRASALNSFMNLFQSSSGGRYCPW